MSSRESAGQKAIPSREEDLGGSNGSLESIVCPTHHRREVLDPLLHHLRSLRVQVTRVFTVMQEDLIVVDDNEPSGSGLNAATNPTSFYGTPQTPATPMSTVSTSGRPRRAASMAQTPTISDSSDRLRAPQKAKMQPKLKLKLSEKAAAQAPGMSFLGPYDRELDSDDDEDLVFEEQFILRFPPGEDSERLRKIASSREVSDDVWFKFKGVSTTRMMYLLTPNSNAILDSRRGIFHIGNSTYSSKLVDLPCVIESQKTLDNKQLFKVADICQVSCGSVGSLRSLLTRGILDARGRRPYS